MKWENKMFKFIFAFLIANLISVTSYAKWEIKNEQIEIKDQFVLTQEYETYTGDPALTKTENSPKEGFKFVLIKILVEKTDADKDIFNSQHFKLKTKSGEYSRADDQFLSAYDLKPFTRLKIKKGKHTGYLLFEVPSDDISTDVSLFYNNESVKTKGH